VDRDAVTDDPVYAVVIKYRRSDAVSEMSA